MDWCWSWHSDILATWCKELTHLKRPWCWESLKAGGEGDDRGWDDWMASLTRWTWIWVNSRSWWWTGRPGVLRFMGSQRVGHNWATGPNWIPVTCSQFLPTKFTAVLRSSCNNVHNVCLPLALPFVGRNLICLICGQAQNGNALNRWINWCRKEWTPSPMQRCWLLWELKVTKTKKNAINYELCNFQATYHSYYFFHRISSSLVCFRSRKSLKD